MILTQDREWLEADGLGGFASGTVSLVRTRRYHAVLLAATDPPAGRTVLVNGFDAFVETEAGRFALSSQRYAPDVVSPDGASQVESFTTEPWPRWTYRLGDGTVVEQELFVTKDAPVVATSWRIQGELRPATLTVRPFLSGRDYHALHHENGDFRFEAEVTGDRVSWQPYASVPRIVALPAAGTSTTHTGTGASSMPRSRRAGSTTSRTWPLRGRSASTWSAARRCCSWPPRARVRRASAQTRPR